MPPSDFDDWLVDRLSALGEQVESGNVKAALERFQSDNDLPVTGLACASTRIRIRQQPSKNPASPLIIFHAVPPCEGSEYAPEGRA